MVIGQYKRLDQVSENYGQLCLQPLLSFITRCEECDYMVSEVKLENGCRANIFSAGSF